jgi:hypothetical protein
MTAGNCSIILLACCAACGEREPPSRADEPSEKPDTAQIPAPVDSVATPAADTGWTTQNTDVKRERSEIALLKAVRTAAHPGFERITFEFAGVAPAAYHIEYIDRPVRACGSGEPVAIEGDAWLEVRFNGANAHDDKGAPTVSERDRRPALPIIRQLTLTCDFEAEVTWVAGVSTPARYRLRELAGPARVVVDLRRDN